MALPQNVTHSQRKKWGLVYVPCSPQSLLVLQSVYASHLSVWCFYYVEIL